MQKPTTSRNPVTSVRLSDLTRKQINELTAKWGCSLADVITILIDRAYQKEMQTMSNQVINRSGKEIDYEAAVNLMDDDLREQLHNSQEWQSSQQFFTAYEKAHAEKYGSEWELSRRNPVW